MTEKPLPSTKAIWSSPTEEATSRTLILALINRYAAIARGRPADNLMMELFEPDATIDLPDGRKLRPNQLGSLTSNLPPELLRHHLTTIDIQFVSSTEAHCQSYIIAGSHLKIPDHWGRWDDVITRQSDGTWLFSKKVIVIDGLDPDGWLAKVLPQ